MPLNSSLFFVLDQTINSHSTKPGTVVRAHLRDPLIVGGVTVAPAGTPVDIEVVQTSPAQMANVNGSVTINFEPLTLPGGQVLPLYTPTSHIDPHMTAGQVSTKSIADTAADIVVPYYYIYSVVRKGADVDLRPGTVIRARTAATLKTSPGGAVVIATPPPFTFTLVRPHALFSPEPFATARGFHPPTPKPSPSASASP